METSERIIVKGKRTKRQRLISPQPATNMTSSSIVVGGDDDHSENISSSCSRGPTTSTEFCGSTEEEEDMANCLILLAQGGSPNHPNFQIEEAAAVGKLSSRKLFSEAATAMKPGFYAYECKTCNRCFPSFQALGGHRASHKKPKTSEEKKALEEENSQMASSSTSPTKAIPYNKSRVHECSICGSEFSSGQALGGHMRRHRTATIESQENIRKERNVMSLDLNLPAPEEDLEFPGGFAFSAKQLPLMFAGSSLVDCPY